MIKAKLDRVAIIVRDVNQAVADMEKMLGCEFYGPFDDKAPGLVVALPKSGGIELVSPARDDDAIGASKTLETRGEGIAGISLRVDDIEAAERHFAELGLKPDVRISHGGFSEIIFLAQEATHNVELSICVYPESHGMGLEVARDLGVEV